MKIKVTEIEATSEELRQSNTLADGLSRILKNAFNSVTFNYSHEIANDDNEKEDDEE